MKYSLYYRDRSPRRDGGGDYRGRGGRGDDRGGRDYDSRGGRDR